MPLVPERQKEERMETKMTLTKEQILTPLLPRVDVVIDFLPAYPGFSTSTDSKPLPDNSTGSSFIIIKNYAGSYTEEKQHGHESVNGK